MTLSTKAEHEYGREHEAVCDEVTYHVSPEGRAEEFVMGLEGSECLRRIVRDPKWQAQQLADAVEAEAGEWAGCYTEDDWMAEDVAVYLGERAYQEVLAQFEDSPAITVKA